MEGIKDIWRATKNVAYGYSGIQAKLREATSIESSGPSTAQLHILAEATHHPSFLADMIYIFDKRLNDHGKYWRHVYKTLVVLEFCVVAGSEAVVKYAKDSLYIIKTLKEFLHVDELGRDKGVLIREKSRDLVELLTNEGLLAEARRTATIPSYYRSKSAEPILVDPKQRKRIGDPSESYNDLQRVDENEAIRIALEESRREAGIPSRYKSLELDTESHSSAEEEDAVFIDPFSTAQVAYVENPFAPSIQQPMHPNPLFIDAGAWSVPAPVLAAPAQLAMPAIPDVLQIEYRPTSLDRHVFAEQTVSGKPFVPLPSQHVLSAENHIAAKPVGPQSSAPQFAYAQEAKTAPCGSNPFQEDNPFAANDADANAFGALQK